MERNSLTERMLAFFKSALLQMRDKSGSLLDADQKIFVSHIAGDDMNSKAENAIRILAKEWFERSSYDEIIDHLTGINLPFANYYLSVALFNLSKLYEKKASDLVKQTIRILQHDQSHPLQRIIQDSIRRFKCEEVGQLENAVLKQSLLLEMSNESSNESSNETPSDSTDLPEII